MATTKILVSGLTGRIGQAMMQQLPKVPDIEIVAGMKRDFFGKDDFLLYEDLFDGVEWLYYDAPMLLEADNLIDRAKQVGANAIVDVSHPSVFCKVVELAVRLELPLISITSGLSDLQMAMLQDATGIIPIFRDGNCRFKVKIFIDEVVKLARRHQYNGGFDLYENFYHGKKLPSETSKVLQRKLLNATGRTVKVHSSDTFAEDTLICDWEFQAHRRLSPSAMSNDKVRCRTIGFNDLAENILRITKIMARKPIKQSGFYNLDELWDELASWGI